jgi:photosystem II stability/assembly factor-like uncharacterized protein
VKPAVRGLLVLVAAAVVTQAGAATSARRPLVTRPASAIFWTPQRGLIAVGYCVPGSSHCVRGAIERTTDGGRTYHVVLRARHPMTDLQTVGSRGAIATASDGEGWRTLDGGRTWRSFIFKPYFWATPRIGVRFRGYFRGSTPQLALTVTHDGGRTWSRRPDPCNHAVTYNVYADLVTPKQWWVVCAGLPASGTMEKAIFRTSDGGKTWRAGAAFLLGPPKRVTGGFGLYGYPNGLAFARNGFGFVTESQGSLFVSRDGSLHFHSLHRIARPNIDTSAGAAVFSSGVGYVLLAAGFHVRLVATHDFGRNWRVVRRWGS